MDCKEIRKDQKKEKHKGLSPIKIAVHQFDFVKKTPEQMEEVKNISDMARIMYIILIHCNFVPTDYLCLLAIIMTQHDDLNYCDTTAVLSNEFYVDLLLDQGAITLEAVKTKKYWFQGC